MPKRTPLYDEHLKLNAKMVEFGGWDMPVSYSGIIEEHMAVRNAAGLFDVGHMGVVEISGADALPFIQKVATNDASKLSEYRSQYSVLCNERGGVVDDILVYRLPDKYMLVLNASNTEKDLVWFQKNLFGQVKIAHRPETRILSLQGPKAEIILSGVCDIDLTSLKRNSCAMGKVLGRACLTSRTGYTGGDGFELFISSGEVAALWRALLDKGRVAGLLPCGLGARDSLRIEAALPLYGHEYTGEISPIEAGYGWAIKFEKGDFIGRSALAKLQADGAKRKLVGIELKDRAIPRQGFKVFSDGKMNDEVGEITSGTFSPVLNKSIALAYVKVERSASGLDLFVNIRNRAFSGIISALPFYKRIHKEVKSNEKVAH